MLLHPKVLELCTFHAVFLFFVRSNLVKAISKGTIVTVDLCHHV
jgi:hypothetical protein